MKSQTLNLFCRNLRLAYQAAPRQALLLLGLNVVMIFAPIVMSEINRR